MGSAQQFHIVHRAMGRQQRHLIAIGVSLNHIEGRPPYRPRRTQYRYPTHRSVTDQQKAKSKNRRGATDTVEAIQQTAVARQQRPGVFQAHFPFK